MRVGPIQMVDTAVGPKHSPRKNIQVTTSTGKTAVLFDNTYPYALQADVQKMPVDTVILQADQSSALAKLHQVEELAKNGAWMRAGLHCKFREGSVPDGEDGWYNIANANFPEGLLFAADEQDLRTGIAKPRLDLELRGLQKPDLGIFVDAKLMPNDAALGGLILAAYPAGLTAPYPAASWTFAGVNGNITVVESPASIMRAQLANVDQTMQQGRCRVVDEGVTAGVAPSTEVFWDEHRNLNGYTRIDNELVRYTLHPGDNAPLIEVWSGSAWVTIGGLQLQCYSGSVYTVLPLQSARLELVSPDEVQWSEIRFDAASTALVRLTCRIRRGDRKVLVQLVSASGLPLNGAQSVGLVGAAAGTWTATASSDGTGTVFTSANTQVPGFLDLSSRPAAASVSTTNLYSGYSVAGGSVIRFAVLAGLKDAQWTALGSAAAYAGKWAAYGRYRVKQRLLIG